MQGLFGGTLAGGSDVLGIAIVLAVALAQEAKYFTPPRRAPCDNNASSRSRGRRSSRAPRRSTFDLLIYQRIVIIRISY